MQRTRSWLSLLAATVAGLGLHCGEEPAPRPNLLLITLEEVRPDDLACYAPRAEEGYAICDLAEEGGRFVWAFSPSPASGPTAASVLTGRSPAQHRVRESVASFLPETETTLAERLRDAGYATAAFISNPELNRSRHFHQGFDVYRDRLNLENLIETARDWADSAKAPWFIWAHLQKTEASAGTTDVPFSPSRLMRVDRAVSELVDGLADQSRPRGILLTSLHGHSDSEAGTTPTLELQQLRVPLFWRPPNSSSQPGVARKIRTSVSLMDVAPTLIEAATPSSPAPPGMEGMPLPYADLPKRPDRTLVARHAGETLVIHGAEFALFPNPSKGPDSQQASGRLWPPSDPSSEQNPALETNASGRSRHQRLKRLLHANRGNASEVPPIEP